MTTDNKIFTTADIEVIEPELSDDQYIESLNDIYGTVEICGMTFDAGDALKKLDPVAFHCGKIDFENGMDNQYKCPICGELHDDVDDAGNCCAWQCSECDMWFEDSDDLEQHMKDKHPEDSE